MSNRKKKWGTHVIEVEQKGDVISWNYEGDRTGGYVRIEVERDGWVFVVTDEEEGAAMFPSALLSRVRNLLRDPSPDTPPDPQSSTRSTTP